MHFDRFTSLYEIFIVSNLASIVSSNFNDAIEDKILVQYELSKKTNENIKSIIGITKETIESKLDSNGTLKKTKAESIAKEFKDLHDEHKSLSDRVEKKKYTESISEFIPVISLFSAFYSTAVLIFSGFSLEKIPIIHLNAILILSVLSLLFVIGSSLFELTWKYHQVAVIFAIILIVYISTFFWLTPDMLVVKFGVENLLELNIILSLIIPISHYTIFIVKAACNARKESENLNIELREFYTKFKTFQTNNIDNLLIAMDNIDFFVTPKIVENTSRINKPEKKVNTSEVVKYPVKEKEHASKSKPKPRIRK